MIYSIIDCWKIVKKSTLKISKDMLKIIFFQAFALLLQTLINICNVVCFNPDIEHYSKLD